MPNKRHHKPQHQDNADEDPSQLKDGHPVTALRHAGQPAGAALQRGGEVGEGIAGGVDDAVVARIVVDVDGDAAQRGDFVGELIEAGVVLSRVEMRLSVSRKSRVCLRFAVIMKWMS